MILIFNNLSFIYMYNILPWYINVYQVEKLNIEDNRNNSLFCDILL